MLAALSMYLLSATHASKFDEWDDEDSDYAGDPSDLVTNENDDDEDRENKGVRRRKIRPRRRPTRRRALADRTQWGSYREQAPPVIPISASSPHDLDALWYLQSRQVQDVDELMDVERETHEEEKDEDNEENMEENVNRSEITSSSLRTWLPTRLSSIGLGLGFEPGSWASTAVTSGSAAFPTLTLSSTVDVRQRSASPRTQSIAEGDTAPEQSRIVRRSQRVRFASEMAVKTHWWITLWFLVTTPVIMWDAGYLFMRPRSMRGGDLHWIWKPYSLYQDVDYIYGLPALTVGDGFPNAQSLLNLVETALNILYVYRAHVTGSPSAPLIGFGSAIMTLSKTALYWLQEYYCGWCSVGHNNAWDLFLLWIIPNGMWLIFPSLIIYQLGKDMASVIGFADKLASSGGGKKKKQ